MVYGIMEELEDHLFRMGAGDEHIASLQEKESRQLEGLPPSTKPLFQGDVRMRVRKTLKKVVQKEFCKYRNPQHFDPADWFSVWFQALNMWEALNCSDTAAQSLDQLLPKKDDSDDSDESEQEKDPTLNAIAKIAVRLHSTGARPPEMYAEKSHEQMRAQSDLMHSLAWKTDVTFESWVSMFTVRMQVIKSNDPIAQAVVLQRHRSILDIADKTNLDLTQLPPRRLATAAFAMSYYKDAWHADGTEADKQPQVLRELFWVLGGVQDERALQQDLLTVNVHCSTYAPAAPFAELGGADGKPAAGSKMHVHSI